MKRSQLAHILRSACRITGDPNILVIGSQSILGKFSHVALPDQAWLSVEADISFFDDPDDEKADLVDGAIGEASPFHDEFGVYGQGVTLETAHTSGRMARSTRRVHTWRYRGEQSDVSRSARLGVVEAGRQPGKGHRVRRRRHRSTPGRSRTFDEPCHSVANTRGCTTARASNNSASVRDVGARCP